jgi:hypothetical protein
MPRRVIPKGPGQRVPVMTRTTRRLRDQLETAASESGRSLAQEVELRLQESFERKELFFEAIGGTEDAPKFRAVIDAMRDTLSGVGSDREGDRRLELAAVLVALAQGLSRKPAAEILPAASRVEGETSYSWPQAAARAVAKFHGVSELEGQVLAEDPSNKEAIKRAGKAAKSFRRKLLSEIMGRSPAA